jgi:hypothetical protein
MNRRRILTTLVATLALTGTVAGVVMAATDTHAVVDLTAIGKNPPRSAEMTFTIENADGTTINGAASMDMRAGRDAIDGYIEFPVVIAKAHLDLRLVDGTFYVGSPMLRTALGAKWLSNPVGSIDLAGLALEMAKPEFSLLSQGLGSRPTVTVDGDHTTRRYVTDSLGDQRLGRDVIIDITTGPQGQVLDATIDVQSSGKPSPTSIKSSMKITMHMVSYNQPVSIVAPAARDVKPMTSQAIAGLSNGNSTLQQILSGGALSALGGSSL